MVFGVFWGCFFFNVFKWFWGVFFNVFKWFLGCFFLNVFKCFFGVFFFWCFFGGVILGGAHFHTSGGHSVNP